MKYNPKTNGWNLEKAPDEKTINVYTSYTIVGFHVSFWECIQFFVTWDSVILKLLL